MMNEGRGYTLLKSDSGGVISLSGGRKGNLATIEAQGRLMLWREAIVFSSTCLSLGIRARKATEQDNILSEHKKYLEDREASWRQHPDYDGSLGSGKHMRIFDAQYTRPFPTWLECRHIYEACVSMAVISFCQVLSSGYPDPGKVSVNNKAFREEHWTKILDSAFSEAEEKNRFLIFCDRLKSIRDEMLGHADGNAYEVEHGHGIDVTRHKTITYDIYDLDLKYWTSFLEPLRLAIERYSTRLEEEPSTP